MDGKSFSVVRAIAGVLLIGLLLISGGAVGYMLGSHRGSHQYTAEEVGSLVEQWPARYSQTESAAFGTTRLLVAVADYCRDNQLSPQGFTPEAFTAVERDESSWLVWTYCRKRAEGGAQDIIRSGDPITWLFREEGPTLLPLRGFAGEMILFK
jgi:hypothetical protein